MPRTYTEQVYVYRVATGELVSIGTVTDDVLPSGLGLWQAPPGFNPDKNRWDATQRACVPYTNTARIAELRAQRDSIEQQMTVLGATPETVARPR